METLGKQINQNSQQYQLLNLEVTTWLKYLSNHWRLLDLPLIKCGVELDLLLTKDRVLITTKDFKITNTRPYVQETLSRNNSIKTLENLNLGFKRTIPWNKYKSEVTTFKSFD